MVTYADGCRTYTQRRRNGREENLFGNTLACKRLEVLLVGFAKGWYLSLHSLRPMFNGRAC